MVNLIQDNIVTDSSIKPLELLDSYLIKDRDSDIRLKLKPIKNDFVALEKIRSNKQDDYIMNSNITKNYLYFRDLLRKLPENRKFKDVLDAIKKLQIVSMGLSTSEDNPQLIFESLNSTGLDLQEADKVRNFLLMNLDNKTQEEFYEHYWNQIEAKTDYNVSLFLKDYFSFKERRVPNINNVY
jgi:uncharacterized protein with ParB-like and HNH nuclease domain